MEEPSKPQEVKINKLNVTINVVSVGNKKITKLIYHQILVGFPNRPNDSDVLGFVKLPGEWTTILWSAGGGLYKCEYGDLETQAMKKENKETWATFWQKCVDSERIYVGA